MQINLLLRISGKAPRADHVLSKFNMDYGILFSKRKYPLREEERPCDDDPSP